MKPLDLSAIKTVSLSQRTSKVTSTSVATVPRDGSFSSLWDSLPDVLAARDLRALVTAIRLAKKNGRAIIWGMGGHVIKCGLSPLLVDLMKRGYVQAIATNGSVPVHDLELALVGSTSEDVDASLPDGQFGVTEETGALLCQCASAAYESRSGLGAAIGKAITERAMPHESASVFAQAYQREIPATVHVSMGCDVWHLHPNADGAAIGASSLHDFRLFASAVANLDGGGVYLNVGSAVVMPEVFLKAVTAVRNIGRRLEAFTTANLDFLPAYRPSTNVVRRPVAGHGQGFNIIGHHELLLPLLHAALCLEDKP